ncbi:hypothetical protein [Aquipuribacter sp. SD81]|uniref:hypothetical protein n=1 Tax=Aquipuribacter sp. SD81 TaxID=3127703 RepID=UPI00301A8ACE
MRAAVTLWIVGAALCLGGCSAAGEEPQPATAFVCVGEGAGDAEAGPGSVGWTLGEGCPPSP